jgi:hypothetical protein
VTIYVFTGPTLSADEARTELDAIYLPPVSQGDVYRVTLARPQAIGIIDGYFERVPAVWHKEILWALSQGIHVYGSASMGALRAAELAAFGMEGVGRIFEAYRAGVLEDDDEVAVAHGAAETGYQAQSEAMVNIRFTLAAAAADGVISEATRDALQMIAKDLFYPERVYPSVLRLGAEHGLPQQELAALRAWLPSGRINQKRDDALAMLHAMRERLAVDDGPKQVRFTFEHTVYWEHATNQAGATVRNAAGEAETLLLDALLDELRLDSDAYHRIYQGAMLRHLALAEAQRQGFAPGLEAVQASADAFRLARRLIEAEAVEGWLAENQLTEGQFGELLREQVLLGWVGDLVGTQVARRIPDHLRVLGDYGRHWQRAQDKQRILEARGLQNPGLADAGLTAPVLLEWHFHRLGQPVPPDIPHYAATAGFIDEHAFQRALLREYLYLQATGGQEP